MYSLAIIKGIEKEKPRKSTCFRDFLARHAGFERAAFRLGDTEVNTNGIPYNT
jgi:hypothetical protein